MIFRVEQTTTWFVEAASQDAVERFLVDQGVEMLGAEDSISEDISREPDGTMASFTINDAPDPELWLHETGAGLYNVLDQAGNPQVYQVTRLDAHDRHGVTLQDCQACQTGETMYHEFEQA